MKKFLIKVDGKQYEVEVEEVQTATKAAPIKTNTPKPSIAPVASNSETSAGGNKISAPMPGNILKINVNVGEAVTAGQTVLILEAMKMENAIKANTSGKVAEIKVAKGEAVATGQVLIVIN